MNAFIDREKALEAKFQHEQMLQYKIIARRNRLLGLWAAQQLDYTGEQAEAYAREIVGGAFSTLDGQAITQKILKDFEQHDIKISLHNIQRQLQYCQKDASEQILNE